MNSWVGSAKWQIILSYATLFILFVFSIIFYRERTIHTDNAFQHFLMIKEGFPQIMEHRYGAIFIKSPTYLALLLGASIPTSLLVFSTSYILMYGTCFYLLLHRINNEIFALLIPVFLTTMFAYDFYWCASEQITGIVMMLLLFGTIKPNFKTRHYWFFGLGLIVLINFFHPLIILPASFLIIYLTIEQKRKYFLIWFLFIGIGLVFKNLIFTAPYDAERISTFYQSISENFAIFWKIQSFQDFFVLCRTQYPFFYIFTFSSLALLIYSKSFIKLAFWLSWMFAHLLIISINEPIIHVPFYAESNFLIFGIYAVLPFFFEAKRYHLNKGLLLLLFICFSTSIVRIYNFHIPFTKRVEYLSGIVNNMSSSKAYLNWEDCDQDILITEWAVPFETALLSAFANKAIQKTIYVPRDPKKFIDRLEKENEFISVFGTINLNELNNKWIQFSYEPYQKLIE